MSFLTKPPYDRPVLTLAPHHPALARLGHLLARKRAIQAEIRAIDRRIKSLLTPRKSK